MRSTEDERVRVARVRIERHGRVQEIAGCWIAIDPARNGVGVWLAQADAEPLMTVSLEDVMIDWHEMPAPMAM